MQEDAPDQQGWVTLVRSETLLVKAGLGRGSEVCFVTFDPMGDRPTLDRRAFAETFLAASGYDAVHILSARNGWYQEPDLPDALARVRSLTRGYRRVVAYGSSMGGYAALRFSGAVGAHAVVAISPQYSMQASVAPFETRWTRERERVTWLYEEIGARLPPVPEAIIFADVHELDAQHAAAIRRDLPGATVVPMPYAGHPAGTMLAELGLMGATIRAIADGTFDPVEVGRTIRLCRRRSGQYLYTLARRQPHARLKLKARLAERAVEANPTDPTYMSYAALVLECLGKTERALGFHSAATRMPGHGMSELRRAQCLHRLGRIEEARLAAERARHLLPLIAEPLRLCALMRASEGRPGEALTLLATQPRLARRPNLVNLMRAAGRWAILRTEAARAIGRLAARARLRQTLLHPDDPRRQLALADRLTR